MRAKLGARASRQSHGKNPGLREKRVVLGALALGVRTGGWLLDAQSQSQGPRIRLALAVFEGPVCFYCKLPLNLSWAEWVFSFSSKICSVMRTPGPRACVVHTVSPAPRTGPGMECGVSKHRMDEE